MPATASAATKIVDMGLPTASTKTFQKKGADVNDYFPHETTIHVGDSIRFTPTAFHTVDLPAKGAKPLGTQAPAGTTSGVVDAAGKAFWFNGQPMLGFNPALLKGIFGKRLAYTGAKRVASGLPLSRRPKPFTVKFTKAGSYTYYRNLESLIAARGRHAGIGVPVTLVYSDEDWSQPSDRQATSRQSPTPATSPCPTPATSPRSRPPKMWRESCSPKPPERRAVGRPVGARPSAAACARSAQPCSGRCRPR
jgi:plastocyanin